MKIKLNEYKIFEKKILCMEKAIKNRLYNIEDFTNCLIEFLKNKIKLF
jgi:hypothetical protein